MSGSTHFPPERVLKAFDTLMERFPKLDEDIAMEMAWSIYSDFEEMKKTGKVPDFYKMDS